MSIENVKKYLEKYGAENRVVEFKTSSATVPLAAIAVGCPIGQIAKTLSFKKDGRAILIVTAGDVRVDNAKFKQTFSVKAKMLTEEEAEEWTGHAVGGICPFALTEKADVYLDISLQKYTSVFPAAGSANSAIQLSIEEMERFSKSLGWVNVCKER